MATKKDIAKKMVSFKGKKGKESLYTAKGGRNEGDKMSLGRRGSEQPRA